MLNSERDSALNFPKVTALGLGYLRSAFTLCCFCVYSHHLLFCILGWRIGKGEGYADMEYAMMVSMGAVREDTPVITIVHDCQVRLKHPLSSDGSELGDAEWRV